jgi:hypothetical protein
MSKIEKVRLFSLFRPKNERFSVKKWSKMKNSGDAAFFNIFESDHS